MTKWPGKSLRRAVVFLAALFLWAGAGWAADLSGGVVLVLSGGGTKGYAHIGVLQVLEREKIPVLGIVGTSIGSIIGGLAATGYSADDLERIVLGLDLANLLEDRSAPSPGQPRGSDSETLYTMAFDKNGRPTGPLGVVSGHRLLNKLTELVAGAHVALFEDLPIPFAAVATDLETGEAVVLREGSLASAMRASMAIPGVFEPWPLDNRLLVDGGLVANIPVLIAKDLFPNLPVVAVDVSSSLLSRDQIRGLVDVLDQMTTIMTRSSAEANLQAADLVIRPDVGSEAVLATGSEKRILQLGIDAAEAVVPELHRVAATAGNVAHAKRPEGDFTIVRAVRTEGFHPVTGAFVESACASWIDKPLNPEKVMEACLTIQQRDDVGVVDYRLEKAQNGVNVVLVAQPAPIYEASLGGYTSNMSTHRWVVVGAVRRDLFAPGDMLRGELLMGDQWGGNLHYYSPASGYRRQEAFIDARNWRETPANAGEIEWDRYVAGIRRTRWWGQFEIQWGLMAERLEGGIEAGSSWGPMVSLSYNTQDDSVDPTRGLNLEGDVWWSDLEELLWDVRFEWVKSIDDKNRFILTGGAFGGDLENPAHAAYLGGPDSLVHLAGTPFMGEGFAWMRASLRRLLWKSAIVGPIYSDIFVGGGTVFDDSWSSVESPWEVGLALSAPGRFLGGRALVVYDDEGHLSFGFEIGSSYRGNRLIP